MEKNKSSNAAEEQKKREKEAEERRDRCKRARMEAHKNGRCLCNYCDFTGMVNAIHRTEKTSYAFLCGNCAAAEQMGMCAEKWVTWNHELSKDFEIYMAAGTSSYPNTR